MKQRPFFEDSTYRRRFCFRLALVLVYAALAAVFAVIDATFLFTLTTVPLFAFVYEVLRFRCAYRQFGD